MQGEVIIRKTLSGFMAVMIVLFFCCAAGASDEPGQSPAGNKYFSVTTTTLPDGNVVEKAVIHGPPTPPPGFEAERQAVTPEPNKPGATSAITTPAFKWVFGCSAVSGGMLAGYYDRNGYKNVYAGPTNGGIMPLTDVSWPTWTDSEPHTYPNNPLIASHNGVDGRTTKGSIDDYWIKYGSAASDPYITGGWAQHAWGSAIGDYMKTSQSAYGNSDGSTSFWNYTSSPSALTCDFMASNGMTTDGTLGMRQFYQARGYSVTDCYNRKIDARVSGGFSFADYKTEINAGHPVLIQISGHTMLGVGYNDPSTVYVHDTWDYNTHAMTWGGSYSGMQHYGVSVLHLATSSLTAVSIPYISPASPQAPGPTVTFTASATGGTPPIQYQFWVRNPAGTWSIAQAYSTNNTFAWNTAGLATGQYLIQVWARSAGFSGSYQAYSTYGYVLRNKVTAVNFSSITPASPQKAGTPVTFTASATGGTTPIQYLFFVLGPGGTWNLAQAWSTSKTLNWNTAGLVAGTYTIQVQARAFGSTSYDAYKNISYTLTECPGFYTHFNSTAGWQIHNGTWSISSGTYLYTAGLASKWSSASYSGATYRDGYYMATVYRAGGTTDGSPNTLLVGFNPSGGFNASNRPNLTYLFEYVNSGTYSVWKVVGGTETPLQTWTASSAIKGNGWNTLAVRALGGSFIFFINGTPVWSGTDTAIASGRVGLIQYNNTHYFRADQASLFPIYVYSQKAAAISPEQQKLNADSLARGAAGQSSSHSP